MGFLHDFQEAAASKEANIPAEKKSSQAGRSPARIGGRKAAPFNFLLTIILGLFLVASFYGGLLFERGSKNHATPAPPPTAPVSNHLPPAVMEQFHLAFDKLRNGDPEKALQDFQKLLSENPGSPSLTYATTIAALTTGDLPLAETMAESSVAMGYRKSDALALLANIELAKVRASGQPSFADPALRAKELLTQAIEADPLNSGPHIEMAVISRQLGNIDEAITHLQRGKNLVFPVDTIVIAETTEAILKDESPSAAPGDDIPPFALAVRLARTGELQQAAQLFAECRRHLPAETYAFLISDPALRKFIDQPELKDILVGR